MATGYKNDLDEKHAADERFNPSGAARDLYNRETDDSVFDDIAKNYDKTADDSQENTNVGKAKNALNDNRDDAKDKEDSAGQWSTNVTHQGRKEPFNLKSFAKKKGPLAALIAILGGGGILLTGFGAPAMLLMQITDIFTNNFNDAHTALSVRANANIGQKINKARNSFSETSDGKCGIVCKRTTMSDAMVRNLEAQGFKVTPEAGTGKFNRRIVQTLVFPDGREVKNGNEFKAALKEPVRAAAFNKVFNSKTRYFLNSKFGQTIKTKLGINKAYKLAGESKEKFTESFRKSLGLPATAAEVKPNATPEEKLKAASRTKIQTIADTIGKLSGKPSSVVGVACFAYNTNRAVNASVKVAKYSAYAAYAMTFMNAAHKLKAADGKGIDPLVVSELGGILTYTASNKTNSDGSVNELYGLSATDSYGYKAAAYGDTGTRPKYAKANSMESSGLLDILAGLTFFSAQTPEARQIAHTTCSAANNPFAAFAQCAPTLPTVFGYLGCVVVNTVSSAVIGQAIEAAMPLLIQTVVDMNVNKLDENTKGALAGDALYPGAAAILGGHAASYGMKAGNKAEIKQYIALGDEVRKQDIAIAKIEAKESPLDVSNQYSFLGSMVRNLNIASLTNANFTSGATLLASTIPRSLASLTTNTNAGTYMPVAENKANQYGNTECKALASVGVDGDGYCMPAYTKDAEELNADIEANLNYMFTNNYINGDTGAPRTDTPEGKVFQKFLDNCVFRTDAIGETSRAIEDGDDGDYEWFIGRNCNLDTVSFAGAMTPVEGNVKNFRIYAMDEPVNADFDGEESVLKSSTAPATTQTGGGTGENSGSVNPNGWAFPTTAGAPLTQGYHDGHPALDIGSDPNQSNVPIYAMRDGVILSVGDMPPPYQVACASPTGTIQQAVTIEHTVDGQKYISAYHHVEAGQFPFKAGDTVKAGDRIATMGNTGCSFGRHLHVELWKGPIYGSPSVDLGALLYGP